MDAQGQLGMEQVRKRGLPPLQLGVVHGCTRSVGNGTSQEEGLAPAVAWIRSWMHKVSWEWNKSGRGACPRCSLDSFMDAQGQLRWNKSGRGAGPRCSLDSFMDAQG